MFLTPPSVILESLLKFKSLENFFFQLKVTEELEKVKQEMEEKGSSMTDGGECTLRRGRGARGEYVFK